MQNKAKFTRGTGGRGDELRFNLVDNPEKAKQLSALLELPPGGLSIVCKIPSGETIEVGTIEKRGGKVSVVIEMDQLSELD